jgi:hypothetical protein
MQEYSETVADGRILLAVSRLRLGSRSSEDVSDPGSMAPDHARVDPESDRRVGVAPTTRRSAAEGASIEGAFVAADRSLTGWRP